MTIGRLALIASMALVMSSVSIASTSTGGEYRYGSLTPFHPNTPLPSASIRDIAFDSTGVSWFTIYSSGLARYTGDQIQVYGVDEGISSVAVRDLALDIKGYVWVGSDKGLSVSNGSSLEFHDNEEFRFRTKVGDVELEARNIVAGPNFHAPTNRTYILTAHELIGYQWASDGSLKTFRRAESFDDYHGIQAQTEMLWVFSKSNVTGFNDPFDMTTSPETVESPCERVAAFHRMPGQDWVGCQRGGLWRKEVGDGAVWILVGEYDEVFDIVRQNDEVLVATRAGGLVITEDNEVEQFKVSTGTDFGQVRTIARSPNGGLWFGGLNGVSSLPTDYKRLVSVSSWRQSRDLIKMLRESTMIVSINRTTPQLLLGGPDLIWLDATSLEREAMYPLQAGERAWNACESPSDDGLWVSSNSQLFRFGTTPTQHLPASSEKLSVNGISLHVQSHPIQRTNGCVAYNYEGRSGVCFSEPEQVLCVDSQLGILSFNAQHGLPKSSIQSIEIDDQGFLWVGSYSSGLYRSSVSVEELGLPTAALRFESSNKEFNLVTTNVEAIAWSGDTLSLATDQGLVVYERGESTPRLHIHQGNGLGDSYIYALALDGDAIWVGGNRGARKVSLTDGRVLSVIDRAAGLTDQEIPWHQAVAMLPGGRVGLATGVGFYFFDPSQTSSQPKIDTYPVRIHNLDISYSRFRAQNEARVTYGVGPVDGFDRVWYRYRVNGAGGTWSNPTTTTAATLSNLPAFGTSSTFYLEVQASFDRQYWSENLVRKEFQIQPSLWFTWWGLSGLAGVFIMLTGVIVRLRLKNERRRSQELGKLADALSDANSEKERELLERRSVEGELSVIKERASSLSRELHLTESARTRASESLEKVERSLIQAEKLASMGQMIAGVTHELVNPAASLRSALEPLDGQLQEFESTIKNLFDLSDPEALEVYEVIKKDLSEIENSVNLSHKISVRILEYATALRNHARYDIEEASSFSVKTVTEESNLLLRDKLKNVDFVVQFENDAEIEGWIGQMVQLFCNLYTNAVDACRGEGCEPKLRTSCRPAIRNGRQGYEICVDDNGPGLVKGTETKVFEALFTTKPRGIGTGLGLATVVQIVKRHEGEIEATSSKILGGARFVIWLPSRLSKT